MNDKEKVVYSKTFAFTCLLVTLLIMSLAILLGRYGIITAIQNPVPIEGDMSMPLSVVAIIYAMVLVFVALVFLIFILNYMKVINNFKKNYRTSHRNKVRKVNKNNIWDIPFKEDIPLTKYIYDQDKLIVTSIKIATNKRNVVKLFEYQIDCLNGKEVTRNKYYHFESFISDLNEMICHDEVDVLQYNPKKGWH